MSAVLSTTALLLIDVQQGFDDPTHWGSGRSTPAFESNIATLLTAFRAAPATQIIHICHHSRSPTSLLHPSLPGAAFQPYAAPLPSELVISKNVNSAFIGTDLQSILRERKITKLIVCGLTTDHCVSTTVRMAANLGVLDYPEDQIVGQVMLVRDATATFGKGQFDAETVHEVHLTSLNGEFCTIITTEEVLKDLQEV